MTKEEYEKKFAASTKISGFGLEVATHFPCPACAEPDWKVVKILELEQTMGESTECKHCHRSFKGLYQSTPSGSSMEMVQTGGDELPDFLPKMRRI